MTPRPRSDPWEVAYDIIIVLLSVFLGILICLAASH